ncbi:hypothetical protein IRZ70_03660 [Pseudomonas monteilii]|nr:hypothetical protein [Pseudomonas monteilii]
MSGNSLEHVLETMKEINVTLGWGALAVYSRGCLNDLLERHYLERLRDLRSLPLYEATIDHEGHSRTQVQALEFGAPTLSFANATAGGRRVQVTLPILSGSYRREAQSDDDKRHYFVINETMGFALQVDVDLGVATYRDRQIIMLDLRNALHARCNLGHEGVTDDRLATALLRWLGDLPEYQSEFGLVSVDCQGNEPWTPIGVQAYTQAAPGSQASDASNHGQGALLAFFKVKARGSDGLVPTDVFPYLVVDEQGGERYPVTLVQDRSLAHLQGSLSEKLSYPPSPYGFTERARHVPFDTVMFGDLLPLGASFTVEAPRFTMPVGQTHYFILRDQHGQEVRATRWTVTGLGEASAGEYGHIDAKEGRYRFSPVERLKPGGQVIVVTAHLYRDGMFYKASARARVSVQLFELQPEVEFITSKASVELQIAGAGPGYPWRLLGERNGQLLQHSTKQAAFIPSAAAKRKGLAIQQVRVDSDHRRRASIVMDNGTQLLTVQPQVWRKVGYLESLRLEEQDTDFMPEAKRRWTLFGVGELSEDGLFTAPASGAPGFCVATCEIEHQGVVLATGYNVLQIGRL